MSDTDTREAFIAAVRAQVFDAGRECPTCHGDGRVRPGRRIIHCQGSFAGADWDEEAVIAAIREAEVVAWAKGHLGHDLHVLDVAGKLWRFQVSAPGEPSACGGGG